MNVEELLGLNFEKAIIEIESMLDSGMVINDDDLRKILNSDNFLLQDIFLNSYQDLTPVQLKIIERHINENLEHNDEDYLSDLIYFACVSNLDIDYPSILSLLNKSDYREHYVWLATIQYISENLKLNYLEEICDLLTAILEDASYPQNVQIGAALCLFRFTHNDNFLEEIKNWNDCPINCSYVQNTLDLEHNKPPLLVSDSLERFRTAFTLRSSESES